MSSHPSDDDLLMIPVDPEFQLDDDPPAAPTPVDRPTVKERHTPPAEMTLVLGRVDASEELTLAVPVPIAESSSPLELTVQVDSSVIPERELAGDSASSSGETDLFVQARMRPLHDDLVLPAAEEDEREEFEILTPAEPEVEAVVVPVLEPWDSTIPEAIPVRYEAIPVAEPKGDCLEVVPVVVPVALPTARAAVVVARATPTNPSATNPPRP